MVQSPPVQAINHRTDFTQAISSITSALAILAEPGQVVELRIPGINGKRTDSGYFDDFEALARAALASTGRADGIYVTLNPINPALLARSSNHVTEYAKNSTGDKDILRRRWLFVDFDPVRPSGISSSDAEHEAAIERATVCRDWLHDQGIPSVLADSGNGAHLLVPIDLPNTDESTALLKAVLNALHEKYSDDRVEVDTSTVNASRIIKLYGTLARKGDNVPDRPHRQAAILQVSELLAPMDRALLENLAQLSSTKPSTPAQSTPSVSRESISNGKKPHKTVAKSNGTVSDRTVIDEIKAHFDMVAYAESKLGVTAVQEGDEYRLPGNQGFLINVEKGCWYHYGGNYGGDILDLVGYLTYVSSWNRNDAAMFKEALHEAALFARISMPAATVQSDKAATSADEGPQLPTEPSTKASTTTKATTEIKFDLLDVAKCWQHQLGNDLAWDTKSSIWRRWSGTHWERDPEKENFDLLASDMLRLMGMAINQANRMDGVIRLARALCKRQFNASSELLNFKNGTLDLNTMVGHAHQRTDHLVECLPYNYTLKSGCPVIQDFLKRSIPDTDGQRAYMTHIGLALIADRTLHKALVLLGPPRSGKTTLLKLAQLVLGKSPGQFPTAVLFSPESRGANSRAMWIDQSPRLVCLDEFPEEALRDEGEELFKSMTAHGGVSMWLKYRDERAENVWTPKMLFATNNRMRYRDPSGALTRRLLIVECHNSLPDNRLDTGLLDKFVPELGAFAAICIQMAMEVQRERTYPESETMRALLLDIERNGDAVKLWLSENCIFEPEMFAATHTLYQDFKAWCDDNGLHPVSRPKLRDMVCGANASIKRCRQRAVDPIDGSKRLLWGLVGLRLRRPSDDMAEQP
jgi:P4 family phage/plasmid primase-like protien